MKNILKPLAVALAMCAFVCACASPVGVQLTGERALSDAQRIYKNAALVVLGDCVQSHINSGGDTCYDLSVTEVIAGNSRAGEVIHCTQGAMKDGETYLLYLTEGEDKYHTEDMLNYKLLSDAPLPVSPNGMVALSGTQVPLSDIKADIARMDAVISAPAVAYFYKNLAELVSASDEVFIGRVKSLSDMEDVAFRSQTDGTMVENTLPAAIATVEAYGVLKGALNYGDTVELVHSPAMSANLIDAKTLTTLSYGAEDALEFEEGEVYLFFLTHSPDPKQDYRFSVNPIQGYVHVDKLDNVRAAKANHILSAYFHLEDLARQIQRRMG